VIAADPELLPDPDKLRQIAVFVENANRMMVGVWMGSTDPRRDDAVESLRNSPMAADLLAWAEYLEGVLQ
jgi:hypothetical protein